MNLTLMYNSLALVTVMAILPFIHPAEKFTPTHLLRIYPVRQDITRWTIDKARSNVKFTVTNMVISETEGIFKVFKGSMENSKPDFSDARIEFSIDVNSVNTNNDTRDKHLKGDDFFNVKKYPQMKFVSTSFIPAGSSKYKLNGTLTIRDVTRPVTFDVVYSGNTDDKSAGNAMFKATTTIDRFDYGLKWDKLTEAGGLVVSKEVKVTVNVELKKS